MHACDPFTYPSVSQHAEGMLKRCVTCKTHKCDRACTQLYNPLTCPGVRKYAEGTNKDHDLNYWNVNNVVLSVAGASGLTTGEGR